MGVSRGWASGDDGEILVKGYKLSVIQDEQGLEIYFTIQNVQLTMLYTKDLAKREDLMLSVCITKNNSKEDGRKLLEITDMFMTQIIVVVSWLYTYL